MSAPPGPTDLGATVTVGWHHRNLFGGAEQLNLTGAVQIGGNSTNKPGYQFGAHSSSRASWIAPKP